MALTLGNRGEIQRSADGGATWQEVTVTDDGVVNEAWAAGTAIYVGQSYQGGGGPRPAPGADFGAGTRDASGSFYLASFFLR